MADRVPITYTFGNHNHWVDMEWLWGYDVFPSSVRDMLHFCRELGAKGNVNFEGVGYEKLASECPEAHAELRQAVQAGTVEIIGGSYGQPYGLFHGGESNVRQRIYGARTCNRLLGKRPVTFWEEEFDFFPQLPQILSSCGYKYASLFFQWTWHTPEVPKEDVPVVWWEGQDGSRLLTATRNRLNLHQWPEDIQILMDVLAEKGTADGDLIQQWLELMPTPDWMCRSEVLLPKTKELLGDPRFEVTFSTLGEYLSKVTGDVPTRQYKMDDVWHGMTLGKNWDRMRRYSREAEASLLSAETVAAIAGLFGRPYAQWDVYPTWELEEAWRELLQAQHHDNCECEGLCGRMGVYSYDRSKSLSGDVRRRCVGRLARQFGKTFPRGMTVAKAKENSAERKQRLIFNSLGWTRRVSVGMPSEDLIELPPYGYIVTDELPETKSFQRSTKASKAGDDQVTPTQSETLVCEDMIVTVSPERRISQITCEEFPKGMFIGQGGFALSMIKDNQVVLIGLPKGDDDGSAIYRPLTERKGLSVMLICKTERPDGGLHSGLTASFPLSFRPRIVVDQPYGISEVHPHGIWPKKYPTGDWMTSPQWFEEVRNPFCSLSLVDLVDADNPDRGLLIVHDGSQQWFVDENQEIRCLLNAYDPWDEDHFIGGYGAKFWFIPHGPMTNSERWRVAQDLLRPPMSEDFLLTEEIPKTGSFSFANCTPENVVMTALYREMTGYSKVEGYAADWDYPYVLRLVEFDGMESTATIQFTSTIVRAIKADMMGCEPNDLAIEGNTIQVPMRPYEIATVYLDVVEGRKQFRDLDAKREIWATVHRT